MKLTQESKKNLIMFPLKCQGFAHMRRAFFILGVSGFALAGLLWVSKVFIPKRRPHILLITLDTTRRDYVSCYGRDKEITPNLDKLAEEGLRYVNAIAPSSWTLPSHASLFTGVLPLHHGAHYVPTDPEIKLGLMQINRLDEKLPTLAEEMKKAGYRTGAVIGGPLLHSTFGINRGFDYYYDERLHSYRGYEAYRGAHETTSLAIDWLRSHYSSVNFSPEPPLFFLFLNYYDPHNPYQAPEPWGDQDVSEELTDYHSGHYDDVFRGLRELTTVEEQILLSAYLNEIRFMDSQIGRLLFELKQLKLYDSTLIVVTSDHGESFGEHGLLGHGRAAYEELMKVPLLIRYPTSDRKTGVVGNRVSIIAIMPTLLEYIGHPIPATVKSGTLEDKDQLLVAEVYRDMFWVAQYGNRFNTDKKVLYEGDYKLIWDSNGNHELYNISDDTGERDNLWGKIPEIEHRLQSKLTPLIEESKHLSSFTPAEITDELRKTLEALGYL